jgi:DNA-binding GntR family transcriptional regulator
MQVSSARTRLKVKSTVGALAERVRDEILGGTYAPGEGLRQEELAERYGVSRSPLREALRQLESEGWIVYHPNRGAFVAKLGERDVRNFYQVRRILEAGAIRLAIPKITDEQISDASEFNLRMSKATKTEAIVTIHKDFHRSIYEAAGNPHLVEAIVHYHIRASGIPNFSAHVRRIVRCSLADHRALLSACKRRDVRQAERITLDHLDHIEAVLLDAVERNA